MFGLASSAGVFGAIADMLVALYKAAGFSRTLKWVDNFFVIHLLNENWTEQDFMALTASHLWHSLECQENEATLHSTVLHWL